MRISRVLARVGIAVPLFLPGAAAAQQDVGTIRGVVITGAPERPIAGALVLLDASIQTHADDEGRFVMEGVRSGPYRIAAVTTGCHVGLGDVTVPSGGREIHVRLTVELEDEGGPAGDAWRLGERSRGAAVKVITGDEIRRRNLQSIHDAIRIVAPEMLGQVTGEAGSRQAVSGRGRTTVTGGTAPLIVLDGVRIVGRSLDALAGINPLSIDRIEVGKGPASGWRYGLQGVNGVIRVFTRKAGARYDPDTPPERCGFRFPH